MKLIGNLIPLNFKLKVNFNLQSLCLAFVIGLHCLLLYFLIQTSAQSATHLQLNQPNNIATTNFLLIEPDNPLMIKPNKTSNIAIDSEKIIKNKVAKKTKLVEPIKEAKPIQLTIKNKIAQISDSKLRPSPPMNQTTSPKKQTLQEKPTSNTLPIQTNQTNFDQNNNQPANEQNSNTNLSTHSQIEQVAQTTQTAAIDKSKPEKPLQLIKNSPAIYLGGKPMYPNIARLNEEQGSVFLNIFVDAQGRAKTVQIKTSSQFDALDAAAIAHVKKSKFKAAIQDAQAVESWLDLKITFNLRD